MALILPSTPPFPHRRDHHYHLPRLTTKTHFTIKSQTDPPPSTQSIDDASSSSAKKSSSTGLGFGAPSPAGSSTAIPTAPVTAAKKKQKGKKERAKIVRRDPVDTPRFVVQQESGESKEQKGRNENAFLLAWLGLGSIIIIEGLALAASGFLPEEWDQYFVKYLYPSFTPTVFLFVAGTVVYGVVKYLENEKPNSSN